MCELSAERLESMLNDLCAEVSLLPEFVCELLASVP